MSTIKVADLQHISNSNDSVSIASDSSVALKHSGNEKIATTATGVNITGTCTATSFSGSGLGMPATGGTFTGIVTFNNHGVFNASIIENIVTATLGSTATLNPGTGGIQYLTLGQNCTITLSMATGQSMLIVVTATASNYTITWPTMKWSGGSAPTLGGSTPTAIELWYDGNDYYGATIGDMS
tara:strand:+ start:4341 stop:4889 length:549 start_codon:yes stop_codon:yes gene_type:complete